MVLKMLSIEQFPKINALSLHRTSSSRKFIRLKQSKEQAVKKKKAQGRCKM